MDYSKVFSAALKAENEYFLVPTGNISFYYTPRELAKMCAGKSQKVDFHMIAIQDIGIITGKLEFPLQDAI